MENDVKYEDLNELHGIIPSHHFNFLKTVNDATGDYFSEEWSRNIKKNKMPWRKHKKLRDLVGTGRGKAIVGIGAGPSLKKNEDVLKHFITADVDKNFITIASNHQFKPLLDMGVVPDYVLLVDSADVLIDQLCKDIPEEASGTKLITGVYVSPKVIKEWDRQGRGIVFYTNPIMRERDIAKKYLKRQWDQHEILLGGNVLNGAFMIGCGVFQSEVFIGVGNDLSFEIHDDLDKQRNDFYADGEYSVNIGGTGRDEGSCDKRWAGYEIGKPIGTKNHYVLKMNAVGTSFTHWAYKIWLETTMMLLTKEPINVMYCNCTEGGILGVMAKGEDDESLSNPENWYFLDSVCINKHTGKQMYVTSTLKDAMERFINSKRSQTWHNHDAQYADVLGIQH